MMGGLAAIMCAVGLNYSHWFYQNSMYGKGLRRIFGERSGFIMLRVLLIAGIGGGLLLASPWFHS